LFLKLQSIAAPVGLPGRQALRGKLVNQLMLPAHVMIARSDSKLEKAAASNPSGDLHAFDPCHGFRISLADG
jgi:hypothetical protein